MIPGWLEWLILLQPTYIIANIILVLTLLKVYRLFRHRTLLVSLITAVAPIAILALSLAIFLLALLISPFTRGGEFSLESVSLSSLGSGHKLASFAGASTLTRIFKLT